MLKADRARTRGRLPRIARTNPSSAAGRRGRAALLAAAAGGVLLGAVAVAALLAPGRFGSAAPASALDPPHFVEEAAAAGIDHRYDGEFTFFVGGGVAAVDRDDDARPDLYLAGGAEPAALYRNASPIGGALRFTARPSPATDLTDVTGAYPLDIDGDRHTDLVVLRVGEEVILRGLGDCRFERANEALGFDGGDAWTAAFSATWEGDAALPTLAIGNYVVLDEERQATFDCHDNELVRPDEDGDGYAPPVALSPGWCSLSMLFSDWDRSGRRDLRVSNDHHYYRDGEEQLWRVEAGAAPRLYTHDEGWQTLRVFGMGIASQDLTGDGYPEVYLTSQADNKLQTLTDGPEQPAYGDMALEAGVTAHRPFTGDTSLPSTAWHPEFADVNADSFVDLFVSKGNVEAMPDHAARDPNNLLLGQPDGTFVESAEAAGLTSFARSRGAAVVDLNLDGMLDLVVVNRRENVGLWRNVGWGTAAAPMPMGNWIALRLDQPGPNQHAIGAWVEVRVGDRITHRELTVGGGHAGGQLGWIGFGLGTAERAEVSVQWPDGEVGPWIAVEANRFATIERGASEPSVFTPVAPDGG
ncbi:MAG: CRTAC1 family protein [Chloroflexota bacterium]